VDFTNFAGFIIGYIVYDMRHYSLHNAWVRNACHDMPAPAYATSTGTYLLMRCGVISPVWDYAFGTIPKGPAKKAPF
jgi:sterol desaturase/sphingolipid hydroxylase (fatty acid hydroxylase superfamily)